MLPLNGNVPRTSGRPPCGGKWLSCFESPAERSECETISHERRRADVMVARKRNGPVSSSDVASGGVKKGAAGAVGAWCRYLSTSSRRGRRRRRRGLPSEFLRCSRSWREEERPVEGVGAAEARDRTRRARASWRRCRRAPPLAQMRSVMSAQSSCNPERVSCGRVVVFLVSSCAVNAAVPSSIG